MSLWRKGLVGVFGLIACAAVLAAVWFATRPNPSGDYITGMGHLFVAIAALWAGVCAASLAGLVAAFHRPVLRTVLVVLIVAQLGATAFLIFCA